MFLSPFNAAAAAVAAAAVVAGGVLVGSTVIAATCYQESNKREPQRSFGSPPCPFTRRR